MSDYSNLSDDDLLETLNAAQYSALWSIMVRGFRKVEYTAVLHGMRSPQAQQVIKELYLEVLATDATLEQRSCCFCDRPTNDHVICNSCQREYRTL